MSASEATTSEVAAVRDLAWDPASGRGERPVSEAGRQLQEVLARVERNSDLSEDEAMALVDEERAAWRVEQREAQRAATHRTARQEAAARDTRRRETSERQAPIGRGALAVGSVQGTSVLVLMRAVVDTNVLMSALFNDAGVPSRLVRAATTGRFALVVSPRLLTELDGVLRRQLFRRYASIERVEAFLATLQQVAEVVDDPDRVPAATRDPDDDYLVAPARAAGVDVLVSGDRDLTGLALADLEIVTPRAFLHRLDEDHPGELRADECVEQRVGRGRPVRWLGLDSANTGLTVLEYRTGLAPTLVTFNDLSHLPGDLRWTGVRADARP